jgi:uncharacterized repeat protein (TIGR03803 family)
MSAAIARIPFSCFAAVAAALCLIGAAHANAFTRLYSFEGPRNNDGANPYSLIEDGAGNLFGITIHGGLYNYRDRQGYGTVFKFAADGTETVLYEFPASPLNDTPDGGLVIDPAGNVYGTAGNLIFKLTSDGTYSTVYQFPNKSTTYGLGPIGPLYRDTQGRLYGPTVGGGTYNKGVIFRINADGTETVLHDFGGGSDGAYPGPVIADDSGTLYGTTSEGGGATSCGSAGCGTVFKIAADGTYSVLYAFQGGSDGEYPQSPLLMDREGNLIGATGSGGGATSCEVGCGTIFTLSPEGTEQVLYRFQGGSDGSYPGSLVADRRGNLYGATPYGGETTSECSEGCGTLFIFTTSGSKKIIHTFAGTQVDGRYPSGLLWNGAGYLYGIAESGGVHPAGCPNGCGTIFKLVQ